MNLTNKKELLLNLKKKGIQDSVLEAMEKLPRELFVTENYREKAYEDTALPIDCQQTISQPYTVAFMTSVLNIKQDDKILEIGTGSGYQAALLNFLGARVFTVERILELHEQAKMIFRKLGLNINTRYGDGTLGWRQFAPYDKIIVTAAAPKVPRPLFEQLALGGKMVAPIGDRSGQTMMIYEKVEPNKIREHPTDKFKFVPLIGKEGWPEE